MQRELFLLIYDRFMFPNIVVPTRYIIVFKNKIYIPVRIESNIVYFICLVANIAQGTGNMFL